MRTSVIFSLASLLIFAVMIYEGYRYYSEAALERACSDTMLALENTSRGFLLGRTNELSYDFGMQPLGSPERGKIGARLAAIRQKVNELQSAELGSKLAEAEVLSDVLGDYLEDGGKCTLFENMIRMGQANVVSVYSSEYRRAVSNMSPERVAELGQREYSLLSEKNAISKSSCSRKLTSEGEDYCQTLRTLNRQLAGQIESSLKDTKDAHSVLYKSMLAGCVLECEGSEPSCVSDCWQAKKAVFE